MTNIHPIVTQDLSDYLDHRLDPVRRSEVEAAVAANPNLRAELTDLRAIAQALAAMPDYAPRRSFRLGDEYRKPTSIATAPSRLVRLMPLVRQLSVAAALIFMVVAGALFFEINGGSDGSSVTNTADHASQTTEDAGSEAILTERGDSASAGDAPMDDLTALQASDDQPASQAPATSLDDHTTWVWFSVGLGVVAVALGGTWYGLARTGRQDGASY